MKALVCLATAVCLVLVVPPSASGQVSIGFQGGLSLANINVEDDDVDFSSRTGISLGAFLEAPLSGNLSFQPEINYVQKGATESVEDISIALKIDYIEIPLLFKVNIETSGGIAPHLFVGPALGFNLGCKVGAEDSETSVDVDCSDEDIEVKSFDFGAVLGAGAGIRAGTGEVRLGARYNLGLTDVEDSADGNSVKNQAFSFVAGYSFPVGG